MVLGSFLLDITDHDLKYQPVRSVVGLDFMDSSQANH